ncbi:MAG TPA: GAF domain-containing protein [Turneriella sp.]|nr:GAF domain-containing protein [Turneriella sp.]
MRVKTERWPVPHEDAPYQKEVSALLHALLSQSTLEGLGGFILDAAHEYLAADTALFFQVDSEEKFYTLNLSRGFPNPTHRLQRFNIRSGVAGRAITTGKTYYTPNTVNDKHYAARQENMHSALAVPIRCGGETLAVVEFFSSRGAAFDRDRIQFVELLFAYAAPQFEKLYALQRTQRRAALSNTLAETLSLFVQTKNAESVLQEMLRILAQSRLFQEAAFFFYRAETKQLERIAAWPRKEAEAPHLSLKINESAAGYVFKTQQAYFLRDALHKKSPLSAQEKHADALTPTGFIAVPIFIAGTVQAVLSLHTPFVSQALFTEYIAFAEGLAQNLSFVLQNHWAYFEKTYGGQDNTTTDTDNTADGVLKSVRAFLKSTMAESPTGKIFENTVSAIEKEVIRIELSQHQFNKSKTAEALGLNRVTLDKKIQQHKLFEV